MNRLPVMFAVLGLAVSISACAYYPDGPYGPGYGPYPPHNYGPPPGAGPDEGPPPQGDYGPPPGSGQSGPPPQSSYGPPPDQSDMGPPPQGAENESSAPPDAKAAHKMAKMNDPAWCSAHAQKCAKWRAKFGEQGGGDQPPPDEQGPPPR